MHNDTYRIHEGNDVIELEVKVKADIARGWTPLGPVQVALSHDDQGRALRLYVQTIVKD